MSMKNKKFYRMDFINGHLKPTRTEKLIPYIVVLGVVVLIVILNVIGVK